MEEQIETLVYIESIVKVIDRQELELENNKIEIKNLKKSVKTLKILMIIIIVILIILIGLELK